MHELMTTLLNYAFEGVWEFIGVFLLFALLTSLIFKIVKYVAALIGLIIIFCGGKSEQMLEVLNSDEVKEVIDEKLEDIVKKQINKKLGTILTNALNKTGKENEEQTKGKRASSSVLMHGHTQLFLKGRSPFGVPWWPRG